MLGDARRVCLSTLFVGVGTRGEDMRKKEQPGLQAQE